MAKTKLEKLQAAIEAAVHLREGAVVGDQAGQYSQEAVDGISKYIELAHAVAINEATEEAQLDAEHATLTNALKEFKASAVKAPKEPEVISLRGVVLVGPANFKKGSHSVHSGGRIVTFVDGTADVLPEIASALEKDGFIE